MRLVSSGNVNLPLLRLRTGQEWAAAGTPLKPTVDGMGDPDTLARGNSSKVRATIDVLPGERVVTPIAFVALSKGDVDDVDNTAFHYLRRHVCPKPVPNSPLLGHSIWLTEDYPKEILREEISFVKRVGFEVLYLDASWYEDSSLEPGMNDWAEGVGTCQESKEKLPSGMKAFSDAVWSAGMKFGLWVIPPNVDIARVRSGDIPESWLALVDGKPIGSDYPSLAITRQLSLGNPEVIAWMKKELSGVIESWNVEWLKWDSSATVAGATDRGSSHRSGSYVEYAGRLAIMKYLVDRFPQLIAFEMEPTHRSFTARRNGVPRSMSKRIGANPWFLSFAMGEKQDATSCVFGDLNPPLPTVSQA